MDSLTIRVSRNRIIFATYDRLRNMLPDYSVCPNNPDISLNANVHQAIKSTEIAQHDYNFVDIFTDEPTLLVPLKEFDVTPCVRLSTSPSPAAAVRTSRISLLLSS